MGHQVPAVTMSEDGATAVGATALGATAVGAMAEGAAEGATADVGVAVVCEDKATSTDDELLLSPTPGDCPEISLGPEGCYRYMAQAAQIWGADLVGMDRPPDRPHSARGGRYLRHQESLSSNSDVSRPKRQVKLRRQRTSESYDADRYRRPKARELRRQWTTDSSDSGYSKRYSRELLRRQDTEESAGSTRRLIRDLQRQATTESSPSLRLTRQSSVRSGSDNQSLYLLRQSTVETYDDVSTTTDFSRPQSCNSGRNTSTGGAMADYSPHAFMPDAAHQHSGAAGQSTVLPASGFQAQEMVCGYDYSIAIPANIGAPLLSTTSCSLINLSAVDLETSDIQEMHRSLRALRPDAKDRTKRKKERKTEEDDALRKARERVSRRKADDELPRKVRWSIMATGLILLLMSVILVGATLKMAPLIDEMVRKENQDILIRLQGPSHGLNTTVPPTDNGFDPTQS
ncbi:uncharacterized protein [Penaeus vannamei]|uniref:uncharacterized protein n=1 Tax=Penaeus vannamei TaxID=6689 RepID=UPI00387F42B8